MVLILQFKLCLYEKMNDVTIPMGIKTEIGKMKLITIKHPS